jgi:hypothetical protein
LPVIFIGRAKRSSECSRAHWGRTMTDDHDIPPEFDHRPKKKPDTATAAKTTIAAERATPGGGTETDPPRIAEADRYVDDVVERMKVHLATVIGETKKAALLLVEARNKYPDREQDMCKRVGIKFQGTRYYELLSIGLGRKTVAQIRDANAKRKRAEEDRKNALPKPAPQLPPGPPAPKLIPEGAGVREITDPEPEPKSPAAPKMLSAEQAMSLIYPILEKLETQALMTVATQVTSYSARRRNAAAKAQREDAHV